MSNAHERQLPPPDVCPEGAGPRCRPAFELAVSQVVDARPDVVLSHDNTAAIRRIWQQFGQARVLIPDRLAITLDHAVPAPTTKHAQNHAEIRQFVAEQGIRHFFEVGPRHLPPGAERRGHRAARAS